MSTEQNEQNDIETTIDKALEPAIAIRAAGLRRQRQDDTRVEEIVQSVHAAGAAHHPVNGLMDRVRRLATERVDRHG